MDSIKCVSGHAEPLSDGRNVAVGEVVHNVDLELPENERLLREGRIIVAEAPPKRRRSTTLNEGDPPNNNETEESVTS